MVDNSYALLVGALLGLLGGLVAVFGPPILPPEPAWLLLEEVLVVAVTIVGFYIGGEVFARES